MGYLTLAAAPAPDPTPLFDRLADRRAHYHHHAQQAAQARRRGDLESAKAHEAQAEEAFSSLF